MNVQTDERLLRDIEGYLIELVCNVESMDELNLVGEALVSVQDALRHLAQEPICSRIQRDERLEAKQDLAWVDQRAMQALSKKSDRVN